MNLAEHLAELNKKRQIALAEGRIEETFPLLKEMCAAIEQAHPGTRVKWNERQNGYVLVAQKPS